LKILETVAIKKNISIDEGLNELNSTGSSNQQISPTDSVSNIAAEAKKTSTSSGSSRPAKNSANISKPQSSNNHSNEFKPKITKDNNSVQNDKVEVNQMKRSLFTNLTKLTYLNACDGLSDEIYNFMLESTPGLNQQKVEQAFNNQDSLKTNLNKHILDYLNTFLTEQVNSSPLYSLSIETNNEQSLMYVYIKFLNHMNVPNWPEKRLVRILELKAAQNEIKQSKFLFESLKGNVIQTFNLNKQNLMCLCIDNRLLDTLCFSTLQLYLNDLFNNFIMILPLFNIERTLNMELNEWNFSDDFTFRTYFTVFQEISTSFKSKSSLKPPVTGLDFEPFKFELRSLKQYLTITEWFYVNYAQIVTDLENANLTKLHEKLNSLDFYFMTCLFCDFFKFMMDFMRHAKHMNNFHK
jgi:hypothetical protein